MQKSIELTIGYYGTTKGKRKSTAQFAVFNLTQASEVRLLRILLADKDDTMLNRALAGMAQEKATLNEIKYEGLMSWIKLREILTIDGNQYVGKNYNTSSFDMTLEDLPILEKAWESTEQGTW